MLLQQREKRYLPLAEPRNNGLEADRNVAFDKADRLAAGLGPAHTLYPKPFFAWNAADQFGRMRRQHQTIGGEDDEERLDGDLKQFLKGSERLIVCRLRATRDDAGTRTLSALDIALIPEITQRLANRKTAGVELGGEFNLGRHDAANGISAFDQPGLQCLLDARIARAVAGNSGRGVRWLWVVHARPGCIHAGSATQRKCGHEVSQKDMDNSSIAVRFHLDKYALRRSLRIQALALQGPSHAASKT